MHYNSQHCDISGIVSKHDFFSSAYSWLLLTSNSIYFSSSELFCEVCTCSLLQSVESLGITTTPLLKMFPVLSSIHLLKLTTDQGVIFLPVIKLSDTAGVLLWCFKNKSPWQTNVVTLADRYFVFEIFHQVLLAREDVVKFRRIAVWSESRCFKDILY